MFGWWPPFYLRDTPNIIGFGRRDATSRIKLKLRARSALAGLPRAPSPPP
jgi:hypothetical protein